MGKFTAGMDEASAQLAVSVLGIGEIVDFTGDLAWAAARLRPLTKSYGLSLGDRACLALAVKLKILAVTADKEWAKLKFCKIIVIRQENLRNRDANALRVKSAMVINARRALTKRFSLQ